MSTHVFIPTQANDAFALRFPNRCVYTGEAANTNERLIAVAKYGKQAYTAKVSVPYSEQALREAKRNRRIAKIVFLLVSFTLVIAVFVGAAALRLKGGAIIGLGPLVALFVAAALTGFICQKLLSRKWQSLKDMPMFYFESGNLGLRVNPQRDGVNFWFANDAIGREFAALNK